ncbi:MAG: hypothetical protein ACK5UP_02720, partial [Bacteroidota bacterium]
MKKFLATVVVLLAVQQFTLSKERIKYAVLISANMEWKSVKKNYPNEKLQSSPWGEYFFKKIA